MYQNTADLLFYMHNIVKKKKCLLVGRVMLCLINNCKNIKGTMSKLRNEKRTVEMRAGYFEN